MKKIKILMVLIVATTFCYYQTYANLNIIKEDEDEFLEFLLKSNRMADNEDFLFLIGEAYESLGMRKKSLSLFFDLKSERNKFSLLKQYIRSISKTNMKDFNMIEKQIKSIEDKSFVLELYFDLILKFFKMGENSKIKELSNKCLNILKFQKNDDYEGKIFLLIDLSSTFYKIGQKTEGDKILNKVNKIISVIKDKLLKFQIYEYIMYRFIELNDEKKINIYASKIKEFLKCYNDVLPVHNLNLIEAFIGLRMFDYACELSGRLIQLNGGKDFFKEMDCFLIKSSKFFLSCNIIEESILTQILEYLGTKGIRFLIETGELKRAKDMAEKMDEEIGKYENRDAYYFYLGKKYLKESSNRILKISALNLAQKIKNNNKKIELMTEVAVDFYKNEEIDIFIKIINDVSDMVKGKNFTFSYSKKDFAIILLEAGFPDRSLSLIEKINNKFSQSVSLYKFGSFALTHYNKPLAEKVLNKFEYDSVFKGLLLSKIAAWYLIQGNHIKGVNLFKKAFDIMKKNEDETKLKITGFSFMDYIHYLIKDYINAKINGRIIEKYIE